MNKVITIHSQQITKLLLVFISGLTVASFSTSLYSLLSTRYRLAWLAQVFNLDQESNLPTWYQAMMLLLCAMVLSVIAFSQKQENSPWFPYWRTLAGIFLYLSADEVAGLHELLMRLPKIVSATGFLRYSWVIPASVVVLVLFLKYLKFLKHLPTRTKRLILLAGALYIGGAVGMEMIGGYLCTNAGHDCSTLAGVQNIPLLIQTTIEEFSEMLGIVVFLYALLSYASVHVKEVSFVLKNN